jgi:hypothetical protein
VADTNWRLTAGVEGRALEVRKKTLRGSEDRRGWSQVAVRATVAAWRSPQAASKESCSAKLPTTSDWNCERGW